jgi:hypothetical protein
MASSDDIGVVRSLHEAMAAADFGRLFTYLDPSVVITQDPALQWGGEWVGHDGCKATGNVLDIAEVHRWTLRDGLAVRGHFSIDTPAMLQALG